MIKICCDMCLKEVASDDMHEYKVKVKRKWYSWHEHGWERMVLCTSCRDKFFELYRRKKEC